jgi:replicative DNA helicase
MVKKNRATLRQAHLRCHRALWPTRSTPPQAEDVGGRAPRRSIFEISMQKSRQGMTPISEIVVRGRVQEASRASSEQKREITGVSTGFVDLDLPALGLQPSRPHHRGGAPLHG